MTGYLLDTNTASYIIKGRPVVRQRLLAVAMHEVSVSAVTEGELRYGAARLPAATRLHSIVDEFLIRVTVHPWIRPRHRHTALSAPRSKGKGRRSGIWT